MSLQLKPLHLDIEEIDRKQLAEIRRRFLAINKHRITRIREDAGKYLRWVLDALPVLLHVNHPALPGYQSQKTPSSISDYTPSKIQVTAAKKISRSFSYEKKARLRRDLYSVFLMGSMGTLGQSNESDLDIWVVHRSNIEPKALYDLQKKLTAIEKWAATKQVQLHFFIMPPDYFKKQQSQNLDQENCGSSQHLLLLEEFYRTALLLAGRFPLWWLVPPDEEKNYDKFTDNLIKKRFLRAGDWIDFGGVPELPIEEYFGAALWHLNKAIDSPYKSSLKLLLMEAYAADYPNFEPVCLELKRNIYQGNVGAIDIDPYALIYKRIENYLEKSSNTERINWIRRCLYLKTRERVSLTPRVVKNNWRRGMIETLVKQWQWKSEDLRHLDNRKNWKINSTIEERKSIIHELTQSYRFMSQLAKKHDAMMLISSEDMSVLGRKLHANFERRAEKIERVNPGVSPDLLERELTVSYISGKLNKGSWALYKNKLNNNEMTHVQPVFRHKELMGLMSWAYINGLATLSTQFKVLGKAAPINSVELKEILRILKQNFPVPENSADMQAYQTPAKSKKTLYIINVCAEPMQAKMKRAREGLNLVSERSDPLGFGSQRENLILAVDILSCNSWHEVIYRRLQGETAVLRLLQDVFQNKLSNPNWNYQLRSGSANNANAIEKRMEILLNSILDIDIENIPARFAWNQGKHFQFLGITQDVIEPIVVDSRKELLQLLAHTGTSSEFVLTRFDANCCEDLPLQLIAKNAEKGCLKIYFFADKKTTHIWLSDEAGAIGQGEQNFDDKQAMLRTYQIFLSSISRRQKFENPQHPILSIEYYDLIQHEGNWQTKKIKLANSQTPINFYPVQVLLENVEEGGQVEKATPEQITIYCGDDLFSGITEGKQLFNKIAQHVKKQRKDDSHYPIYITDLDLSALQMDGPRSSLRYLEQKWSLERQLNQTL